MSRFQGVDVHLVSTLFLDGFNNLALKFGGKDDTVLAKDPRHGSVFVPGVRELAVDTGRRVERHLLDSCNALLVWKVRVRPPRALIDVLMFHRIALRPVSIRSAQSQEVAQGPHELGQRVSRRGHHRRQIRESDEPTFLAGLSPLALGQALGGFRPNHASIRVRDEDDMLALIGPVSLRCRERRPRLLPRWPPLQGLAGRRGEAFHHRLVSTLARPVDHVRVEIGRRERARDDDDGRLCACGG